MFVLEVNCMFEDKLKCCVYLFFLDKSTLDRRTHRHKTHYLKMKNGKKKIEKNRTIDVGQTDTQTQTQTVDRHTHLDAHHLKRNLPPYIIPQ